MDLEPKPSIQISYLIKLCLDIHITDVLCDLIMELVGKNDSSEYSIDIFKELNIQSNDHVKLEWSNLHHIIKYEDLPDNDMTCIINQSKFIIIRRSRFSSKNDTGLDMIIIDYNNQQSHVYAIMLINYLLSCNTWFTIKSWTGKIIYLISHQNSFMKGFYYKGDIQYAHLGTRLFGYKSAEEFPCQK